MTALRAAIAALACTLISTAALMAAEEWKTITLGGNPDFTIEVPTAATLEPQSKDPDEFMFLQVQRGMGEDNLFWCRVRRIAYPTGTTQDNYAKAFASPHRAKLCNQDGAKDWELLTSESFIHNGLQAATCAAIYSDPKDKKRPGQVKAKMIIAAPAGMYQLKCNVEDKSLVDAGMYFKLLWRDYIAHMQKSFHLP